MSFDSDGDVAERSLNDSELGREEEVYCLLFSQCDRDETGWAVVDDLVDYIRKMLSGNTSSPKKNEEVYDSDESVNEANYNLDLLKCMLNTHAVDNEINLVTYKYVISKWVKDIRSRSPSPAKSSASEEEHDGGKDSHSSSSNSSVSSLLQESYETSGAGGDSNNDMDPVQMMNSIADLQLEAKRLKERNEQLLLQMESSEENMRQLQTENTDLTTRIRNQQQNLAQLDAVKKDNAELEQQLIEGEKLCIDLKEKIETMQQELNELQFEISDLQNQLTDTTNKRDDLYTQTQTLQNTLSLKEEQIKKLEEEKNALESCLEDQHIETESLQNRLTTTSEAVEELKLENSSLQQQINEKQKLPVSSTPFRPTAPSLHEELANSDIANGMSPLDKMNCSLDELLESVSSNGQVDDGGLFDKLASNRAKFEEKAKLMDDGLSELIDTPLAILEDRNKSEEFMGTSEDFKEVLETSLRKVETKKKRQMKQNQKLSDELKRTREENELLRNKLNDLTIKESSSSGSSGSGGNEVVTCSQSTQTVQDSKETSSKVVVLDADSQRVISVSIPDDSVHSVPDDSTRSVPESDSVRSVPETDSAYGSVDPINTGIRKGQVPVESLEKGPTVSLVDPTEGSGPMPETVPETDSGNSSMTPTKVLTTDSSSVPTSAAGGSSGSTTSSSSGSGSSGSSGSSSGGSTTSSSSGSGSSGSGSSSGGSGSGNDNSSGKVRDVSATNAMVTSESHSIPSSANSDSSPTLPINESVTVSAEGVDNTEYSTVTFSGVGNLPEGYSAITKGTEGTFPSVDGTLPPDSLTGIEHAETVDSTESTLQPGDSTLPPDSTLPTGGTLPSGSTLPPGSTDASGSTFSTGQSGALQTSHEDTEGGSSTEGTLLPVDSTEGSPLMERTNLATEDYSLVPRNLVPVEQDTQEVISNEQQALQEEIARLRKQLSNAVQRPYTSEVGRPLEQVDKSSQMSDSFLVRRQPELKIASILEDSFVTSPSHSKPLGCLSLLGHFLLDVIKTSVWVLMLILLALLLVIVIIGFNSSLARCGGRTCNHSPLQMLFGQNLHYTHSGDVPI